MIHKLIKPKKKTKIAIAIRGHERGSLENSLLKDFVSKISREYNTFLYVHSWIVDEADVSWRFLEKPKKEINENMIKEYFSNENLKSVVVEDEEKISLFGKTDGNLGNTRTPILAWKRMWHGIHNVVDRACQENYDLVLNMRFDLFNYRRGSFKYSASGVTRVVNHCDKYKEFSFYSNKLMWGIDNVYVSTPEKMNDLCCRFNFKLDEVIEDYKEIKNQEHIVALEAKKL